MAKNLFKKAGTARSFKGGPNQQAFVSNIEKQTRTIVDAQKLAKAQAKEQDDIEITGMSRKFDFEEGVLKTKHKLEDAVRKHKYEATAKHADTDVKRLLGEADELEKEAAWLAEIAPKRAKMAGQLVSGIKNFTDFLEYQNMTKQWEASGSQDEHNKAANDASFSVVGNLFRDPNFDKLDGKLQRQAYKDTAGLSKNVFWLKRQLSRFNDTRKSSSEDVRGWASDAGIMVTEGNAYEIYEHAGYMKLRELNVSSTTEAGKKILDQYRNWGKLAESGLSNFNDANDTQAVLTTLSADFKAALESGNKDEQNLILNAAVKLAAKGTYKDGNDYQVGLPDGYGGGLSKFLNFFLEDNSDRYNNSSEIYTDLQGLKVIGTEKYLKGKEDWDKKHLNRIKDSVDGWAKSNEKKAEQAKLLRESEGNSLEIQISQLPEEERKAKQLELIEKVSKSNATEGQKNTLYKRYLSYNPTGYGGTDNYLTARRAVATDDYDTLFQAMGHMDPAAKKRLAGLPSMKALFTINEGQPVLDGVGGWKGFNSEAKGVVQTVSKGYNRFGKASLHTSGEIVVTDYKRLVAEELALTADAKGSNSAARLREAKALVKTKHVDTAVELVPIKKDEAGYPGWRLPTGNDAKAGMYLDNPFNYTTQRGGFPGVYQPGVIFVNRNDHDSNLVNSIEQSYSNAPDIKDKDLTDRNPNKPGVQVLELHDDTLKYADKNEIINHVRLVSPHNAKPFENAIYEDVANPGSIDDIASIMPERLKTFCDLRNESYSKVVNKWLKARGVKDKDGNLLQVSEDMTDAVMVKGGRAVKPKPYNIYAADLLYTTQAQGTFPMEYQVDYSVNEGLPPTEAWGKKFDVKWNVDETSKISMDSTLFFENGGGAILDKQLAQSLGLLKWDPTVGWFQNEGERQAEIKLFNERKRRLNK